MLKLLWTRMDPWEALPSQVAWHAFCYLPFSPMLLLEDADSNQDKNKISYWLPVQFYINSQLRDLRNIMWTSFGVRYIIMYFIRVLSQSRYRAINPLRRGVSCNCISFLSYSLKVCNICFHFRYYLTCYLKKASTLGSVTNFETQEVISTVQLSN